jgi:hypothetical protein
VPFVDDTKGPAIVAPQMEPPSELAPQRGHRVVEHHDVDVLMGGPTPVNASIACPPTIHQGCAKPSMTSRTSATAMGFQAP